HVGCVVDRRRLVWINPASAIPAWQFPNPAEGAQFQEPGEGILGQPQLISEALILADLSGQFIALNPTTGRRLGKGYVLQARPRRQQPQFRLAPDELSCR